MKAEDFELRKKEEIAERFWWLWKGVKKHWFPSRESWAKVELGVLEWVLQDDRKQAPRVEVKEKTFGEEEKEDADI